MSKMYAQKVESIREEPATFQQFIINMMNRLDYHTPGTMKSHSRDWIWVETKLRIMDALLAPHYGQEYQEKRIELKEKFNVLRRSDRSWDSAKFLDVVSEWLYEISKGLSQVNVVPAKKSSFEYEEIGENYLSEEFLKNERLNRKEEGLLMDRERNEKSEEIELRAIKKILEERENKAREELEAKWDKEKKSKSASGASHPDTSKPTQ